MQPQGAMSSFTLRKLLNENGSCGGCIILQLRHDEEIVQNKFAFINRCMRKVMNSKWSDQVNNDTLREITR